MSRPRVLLLRGHHANPWDLRPWERLRDEYDVAVAVTGANLYGTDGIDIEVLHVRTPRDVLPGKRVAGAAAYALGERYLGLTEHLKGAAIVHAAEIGTWFSAQAARQRERLGFRLVLTVWETIPWAGAYRWPRERRYRQAVLDAADLLLPATERAREALLLEGAPADRIEVCPPGVELERFAAVADRERRPVLVSAGRLVWEKGHQDAIRALAALHRGIAGPARPELRLLVIGDGPERGKLERLAGELGVGAAVEFRASVPYDEMPEIYAGAEALVLMSLPTKGWEEQFGMVLVEAQAAGLPVIAAASGAIPEVVGDGAALVRPGDWMGLARAVLVGPPAPPTLERLRHFSAEASAERLRAAYARVLR